MVAAEYRRKSSHVAGALDILVTAQWIEARPLSADVARGQGEVGQCLDVVCAGYMLGYAHGIDDRTGFSRAVCEGGFWQPQAGIPEISSALRWCKGHGLPQGFESFGALVDELFVDQVLLEL